MHGRSLHQEAGVQGVLPRIGRGVRRWPERIWRWYMRRQEIWALLAFDDRLLRDIGLTSLDVRMYAAREGLLDDLPEPVRMRGTRGQGMG